MKDVFLSKFLTRNSAEIHSDWDLDGSSDTEHKLHVDVCESDEEVFVLAPVGGVGMNDVDISVHDGILTIRAQRRFPVATSEAKYLQKECDWGVLSRSIEIPMPINFDKIRATIKNGILHIILPKMQVNKEISLEN